MSEYIEQNLNNGESAEFLKISPATLDTWRSQGRGPRYYKIGRRVIYKRKDLEDFIESRMVRTRDSSGFKPFKK